MSSKFLKFKKGFSLVELIVAIAIILIMTAVLLVSQNSNKAQEAVDVAARQVAAQLRALQNEALNGKQIGTDIVCSFKFISPSSESSITNTGYDINYEKCSDDSVINSGTQKIKLNSGKGNIIISPATSISFSAPWGNATISNSPITLTSSGKNAYVCVCSSGNIFDTKTASCGC